MEAVSLRQLHGSTPRIAPDHTNSKDSGNRIPLSCFKANGHLGFSLSHFRRNRVFNIKKMHCLFRAAALDVLLAYFFALYQNIERAVSPAIVAEE